MSRETMTKSLVSGRRRGLRHGVEEDLTDWTLIQPEAALRNGHAAAATHARRMSLPSLASRTGSLRVSLSDIRVHTPRALLPSR